MEKNINTLFDACTIYILLWLLGHVQNLFLSSSLVSLSFSIPYLLMTLYYIAKVFVSFHPKGAMKALCVFFVVLVCYGVALLILDNAKGAENKSFLMMLFNSLGPIFPFYVFTQQGLLTEKRMKNWFWPFLVVIIITFFVTQQRNLAEALESEYEYEEVTNNTAYSIAGLIPFVFLLRKKPIWQYFIMVLLLSFIVSGMKRGAMLTGALMLFWFVYVSVKTASKGKKLGIVLLTTITLIVGYRYIIRYYENSDYFQHRVEATMEGSSSNRDVIYETLWQHYINNDNILQLAFGEGAYHTQNVTGSLKAHNDWLELLIDCGLITVLLYVVYWMCFVIDWKKSKPDSLIFSMLGACFIYTYTRTFFSMSFSDMPFYINMIMGYCFASINSETILIENT